MKQTLVTTDATFEKLMGCLEANRVCGFDTEAVGPARRYSQARKRPFLNVNRSSLVGASWAFHGDKQPLTFYMPIRHNGKVAKMSWLREALLATGLLDRVWAHNVKFDSRMVHSEGVDCSGWEWADSYLMAWAYYSRGSDLGLKKLALDLLGRESPEWVGTMDNTTGEQVLAYCCHDALNTLEVGEHLEALQREDFPRLADWVINVDSKLVEILGRTEARGVPINLDKLEATLGAEAEEEKATLAEDWMSYVPGVDFNSPKALQVLFEEGIWVDRGKTKKGDCKTGKEILEWNAKNAPSEVGRHLAATALKLRVASKVVSQYTSGFREECSQWPDGRLHPELSITVARTTRFSSTNPNIQNQLSRGKYAPLLRTCFEAPPGMTLVAADYSQQEPRIQAEFANRVYKKQTGEDCALYKLYQNNGDIHQANADAIGRPRADGKTWTMGYQMYGGKAKGASEKFGVSIAEAQAMVEANEKAFPEGPIFREAIVNSVKDRTPWPYVRVISGHRRWLKELQPERWYWEHREEYEAKAAAVAKEYNIPLGQAHRVREAIRGKGKRAAINTPIQGAGAAMAKLAIVNFDRAVRRLGWTGRVYLVTMTHDEVVVACEDSLVSETSDLLQFHMEDAARELGFTLRFPAEPVVGKNWAEIKG